MIPSDTLKPDYGTRTDILSHNYGKTGYPGLKRKINEYPEDFRKLKALICPGIIIRPAERKTWQKRPAEMLTPCHARAESINKHNVPIYSVNHEDFKFLLQDITPTLRIYPNVGITTLQILLGHLPSSLLVAGFSFYMRGRGRTVDSCYIDGHLPQEAFSSLKRRERKSKSVMGHSPRASKMQANYFKTCIVGNGFIDVKVDPGAAKTLGIDNEHIQEG